MARTIARLRWCLLAGLFSLLFGCATQSSVEQPEPRPEPEPVTSGQVHRVKSGDTLYSIAFRYGVDMKQLAAWNGLKPPYTIYPGQALKLTTVSGGGSKKSGKSKSNQSNVASSSTAPEPPAEIDKNAPTLKLGWVWPTEGKVVSYYSAGGGEHDGIRIGGKENQPIVAAEAGEVVYVGSGLVGYGRLIIVKHNNNYLSAYGLNNKLLVKEGDQVAKGQQIAEMGMSNSGTPTLHFEIRVSGKPANPMNFLPAK